MPWAGVQGRTRLVQRSVPSGPVASSRLALSSAQDGGRISSVTLERAKSSELGQGATALRTGHALIAVIGPSSVAYVWACALTRRRNPMLGAALVALGVQGIAIVVGRGNCPLGPLQEDLGDPTPLFELVFPPRVAKAAFPVLLAMTLGGVIALVARPPQ